MNQSGGRIIKGVRLAALVALGATALAVTPAWATVTSWNYTMTSQFGTDATFRNNRCTPTNTTIKLQWGCSGNSSLTLKPRNSAHTAADGGGTITTYTGSGTPSGSFVSNPGITLTHHNFVINGNSLTAATLHNTVTLTSPFAEGPFDLSFGIKFIETTNQPGRGKHCPVGKPPCADIFVFSTDALNHEFSVGGDNYFLSLFPASGKHLNFLSDRACAAAGAASGCFGFVTKENRNNVLHFGLAITSEAIPVSVPEPGELGLMGLGLLGLAGLVVLRRRRTAENKLD